MLGERFWSKVDKTRICWDWTACLNEKGYPLFFMGQSMFRAHRLAYEEFYGKIPKNLTVDHICRNRKCVNPSHLRLLTNKQNVLGGIGITAQNARKVTCKLGHPLVPINTKSYPTGRCCPICRYRYGVIRRILKESSNG